MLPKQAYITPRLMLGVQQQLCKSPEATKHLLLFQMEEYLQSAVPGAADMVGKTARSTTLLPIPGLYYPDAPSHRCSQLTQPEFIEPTITAGSSDGKTVMFSKPDQVKQ